MSRGCTLGSPATVFVAATVGLLFGMTIAPGASLTSLNSSEYTELVEQVTRLELQLQKWRRQNSTNSKTKRHSHNLPNHSIDPKVQLKNLELAIESIKAARSKICHEYRLEETEMKDSFWEAGNSRAKTVSRIQASIAIGGTFIVAFTGMSVCAGHGSLFNESYPMVFDSVLRPEFEKVGVRFTTRNQCMGGTYTFPYAWCISNIAGDDVDVVAWDFGMMEAGRQWITEGWAQQVLKMPSKPGMLFMAGYDNDPLRSIGLTEKPVHGDTFRLEIAKRFADQARVPVQGFGPALSLMHKYKSKQIPKDTGSANFVDIETKDPSEIVPESLKDLRWYSTTGLPGVASWHPAPREHAISGKFLAFSYLGLLLEAVEAEIKRLSSQSVPPPPKLSELIKDQSNDLNSSICDAHSVMGCHTTYQCVTSYEPRQGNGLVDTIETDEYQRVIPPGDTSSIERVIKTGAGYLDRKYSWTGNKTNGPLSFRLHHVSKNGQVIVCEPTFGWEKPPGIVDLTKDVIYYLDGKELQLPTTQVAELTKQCVVVSKSAPPGGHHLEMIPRSEGLKMYVAQLLWS
mmetsp:Transcript_34428/g.83279  ORF Transcript_34428/g.83279 Transcript_34428/m.83279 type:complete len:570 (+) Transcript_34428:248-1957(+)